MYKDLIIQSKYTLLSISIIIFLGVALLAATTRLGIGASPDSVVYFGAANSLAAGDGFSYPTWGGRGEPITHFPPFYPLILAMGKIIGINTLSGARLLNLVLYALNGLLFGFVLLENRGKQVWASVLGTFLFLASIPILTIHSMAWSEALFLLLGFLSLFFLSMYIRTDRVLILTIASFISALALLTRYAGVAFIATGFFGLILLGIGDFRKRLLKGLLYGSISLLPMFAWILRNIWVAGVATNRKVTFHPIDQSRIISGVRTITSWILVPETISLQLLLGIVIFFVVFSLVAVYIFIHGKVRVKLSSIKASILQIPVFHLLLGIFILVYAGFLLVSISFIDANTPLDNRILSPVYWGGALLILSLTTGLLSHASRNITWIILFGMVFFSIGYGTNAAKYASTGFREGIGLNSNLWQQSETIDQVRHLPSEIPIYSNAAEAVYLHTDHPAQRLPRKIELVTDQVNQEYYSTLENMQALISMHQGVLVYFNFFQPPGYPTSDELVKLLSLQVLAQTTDGTIYTSGNSK